MADNSGDTSNWIYLTYLSDDVTKEFQKLLLEKLKEMLGKEWDGSPESVKSLRDNIGKSHYTSASVPVKEKIDKGDITDWDVTAVAHVFRSLKKELFSVKEKEGMEKVTRELRKLLLDKLKMTAKKWDGSPKCVKSHIRGAIGDFGNANGTVRKQIENGDIKNWDLTTVAHVLCSLKKEQLWVKKKAQMEETPELRELLREKLKKTFGKEWDGSPESVKSLQDNIKGSRSRSGLVHRQIDEEKIEHWDLTAVAHVLCSLKIEMFFGEEKARMEVTRKLRELLQDKLKKMTAKKWDGSPKCVKSRIEGAIGNSFGNANDTVRKQIENGDIKNWDLTTVAHVLFSLKKEQFRVEEIAQMEEAPELRELLLEKLKKTFGKEWVYSPESVKSLQDNIKGSSSPSDLVQRQIDNEKIEHWDLTAVAHVLCSLKIEMFFGEEKARMEAVTTKLRELLLDKLKKMIGKQWDGSATSVESLKDNIGNGYSSASVLVQRQIDEEKIEKWNLTAVAHVLCSLKKELFSGEEKKRMEETPELRKLLLEKLKIMLCKEWDGSPESVKSLKDNIGNGYSSASVLVQRQIDEEKIENWNLTAVAHVLRSLKIEPFSEEEKELMAATVEIRNDLSHHLSKVIPQDVFNKNRQKLIGILLFLNVPIDEIEENIKSRISDLSSLFSPRVSNDEAKKLIKEILDAKSFEDYEQAIEKYGKALKIVSLKEAERGFLFSNRSAAYLQLAKARQDQKRKHFAESAENDAKIAANLQPMWYKAHFRLGEAYKLMEKYGNAIEAFDEALRLDPSWETAWTRNECRQELGQRQKRLDRMRTMNKHPQSTEAGTVQQSTNNFSGQVYAYGDNNFIGGIANQRNEVKDGQESPSPKRSRLEVWDTVTEASRTSQPSVAYSQPGKMIFSGPGASSGIVKYQRNTTNYVYIQKEGNSSSQTSQPVDIDKFDCTDLKEYYSTTLCKASPLPWCHWYNWDIDEVYTELALQDSPTSKFFVEGLFKQWDKQNPKGGTYRILIEGDAGYGKSTLMLKMASDWSESDSKDYISRFSLLFVVKLGRVGEDGNLLSYMEEFYKEQIDTPLKNLMKSKGAEVLVLFDGYDEANANTKKEVDLIMKKKTMSKCHVVLTSRCGHVPDDVKGIALSVRVTGFGPRQVAVAVCKFFIKAGHLTKAEVSKFVSCMDKLRTDETGWIRFRMPADLPNVDDFENVQEMDPLLPVYQRLSLEQCKQFMRKLLTESPYKELAQCPLLCVMMCCLVSDCPNGNLPSTVSGLYFAMINRNLYRAARKKPRPAGEVEKQWNWDVLGSQIRQDHESYLQDFGRLCINGLKTENMTFTLFEITGNEEEAKTADVKVTQLIEAGVLVQDTNDHRYQVPHRTTAEFLAAYCLSRETDQNLCQQNLLDLYQLRLGASFDEVAASLIEMGKTSCLAEAFCDIKFPSDCLTRFMKSYFLEHGAAGTWMEFKDALPNKLTIRNTSGIFTVSSAEPNETLLHLCEGLGKGNTGETNARPSDCLVSVHVRGDLNPELLQTLSKSGVRLERLDLNGEFETSKSVGEEYPNSEIAHILKELLKSHSCPVQLSFFRPTKVLIPAVTKAMQEVPEGCPLKRFDFFPDLSDDILPLEEVLAEKWLSHLQHLGLGCRNIKPILKGLGEPGCSLTSLHLYNYKLHIEDLMMLASKLETLLLSWVDLYFNVTEISKYAAKERCSLKSLRLSDVKLSLKGSLPSADENQEFFLGWRNVALNLEQLTIDWCEFPIELFSWLNPSFPNLWTVTIGKIYSWTPNCDRQLYAEQVLEALTRSSGDSIEELSLLHGFWEDENVLMLHPVREAFQRCPRMKSVNLGYSRNKFTSAASIGPGPSTPLSPSDEEAFRSDNIHCALLKIVLSVPKLQTLNFGYFFENWEEIGTFHAIADKAEKWPGRTNDNDGNTSLTLSGLSNENAVIAMHVFRERGLEYRLRYLTEDVYELWFPPRVVSWCMKDITEL